MVCKQIAYYQMFYLGIIAIIGHNLPLSLHKLFMQIRYNIEHID